MTRASVAALISMAGTAALVAAGGDSTPPDSHRLGGPATVVADGPHAFSLPAPGL